MIEDLDVFDDVFAAVVVAHITRSPFYVPRPPNDLLWQAQSVNSSVIRNLQMPNTVTITGTVTDSLGVSTSFSIVATIDVLGATAVVTPAIAPIGTTRNLTVTPNGGVPPYTFGTPVAAGITFTPVAGQPGQWTFVF